MKITKNRYLMSFVAIVTVLAIIRLIFPNVAKDQNVDRHIAVNKISDRNSSLDTLRNKNNIDGNEYITSSIFSTTSFYNTDGTLVRNRINSVPGFSRTFPDNNDIQLVAANLHGVRPVENREDAENRKKELVFIGANPYYFIDPLRSSIPYLVPRAAVLLNDIGRAYYDSLRIKNIPLHQIIVTSVLRSKEDVTRLRNYNGNATENSCHLYGTTFDICYNRYKTVNKLDGSKGRTVRNDTLKWVLSEVLRDMRENNRCYVKYEVKQGCFHITVR